ncbi:hypothetical protein EPN96_05485 [bacterium]|nr:MAG: hypothetical protein EPN96_05485 [bacterium]
MDILILYTLFAVISSLVNIGSQEVFVRLYQGVFQLPLAMAFGTGTGLLVKYALDKKYIFRYRTKSLSHDTRLFILYTSMGLVTTAIFWGFELAFDALFGSKAMRYAGAALGLALGYFIKYHLDKRFVFRKPKT